jgi:hypothetical protein
MYNDNQIAAPQIQQPFSPFHQIPILPVPLIGPYFVPIVIIADTIFLYSYQTRVLAGLLQPAMVNAPYCLKSRLTI